MADTKRTSTDLLTNLFQDGQTAGISAQDLRDLIVSLDSSYIAVSATYTILTTDSTVDCTSGTFTATLPTAVGLEGKIFNIKNSGAGVITIEGDGTETIDGSLNASLATQYESITVQSNNANWIIL